MKRGLYPIIAGTLVCLFILAEIFETQINALSSLASGILLMLTMLIVIGAVLLAMWDTGVIGKRDKQP